MGSQPIDLRDGWQVLQDVHELGETLGIYRFDWDPYGIGAAISPWRPIPRLAHLQLLLARQPYFGRHLRHFNEHPWWYKLEFETPEQCDQGATLHFEGVDYFATVWLNEVCLGDHEGYAEPFGFEVGDQLLRDRPNLLVVRVSSPWDRGVPEGLEDRRTFAVVRNLIKGTYEHADTFIQRDVNPIGIWRPVAIVPHGALRSRGGPTVVSTLHDGSRGSVSASWAVVNGGAQVPATVSLVVRSEHDQRAVASTRWNVRLEPGISELGGSVELDDPRLWSTWDRGGPSLYRADLAVETDIGERSQASRTFGFRTVEMVRTEAQTTILLNGRRIFLRGTNYFPDVYLSNVDSDRYERDLRAMVGAGVNAVRVHVHTEGDAFYDLCDRMGLLVIQDFDLNWRFPTDDAFRRRAVGAFEGMIRRLRGHPCIASWVCQNEPMGRAGGKMHAASPGPQLEAAARRLDPDRPVIRSSDVDDPSSGDSHNWSGALESEIPDYRSIRGTVEKLNTEFGFDAPPCADSASLVPEVAVRLAPVLPRLSKIHDYAYHLHKYFIEHYRRQKYAPCSGYFQFMWIDLSPQSFYGLHDWWGRPKQEGIGGGLLALEESNQPIAVILDHEVSPAHVWVANDTLEPLGACEIEWLATAGGETTAQGILHVDVGPDALVSAGRVDLTQGRAGRCDIRLTLCGPGERVLARNVYRDPFNPPAHPDGHPGRMDHELGMRLYWA